MLGGRARDIIFSEQFEFYSPQATLFEVTKHISWLAGRVHKLEITLYEEFQLLPIVACQPATYDHQLELATTLIGHRDACDVPLLALALARRYAVWSDDRDFEGIKEVQLRKTSELLARIQS
jgi:predicted nucleic acid-binding protein